MPTSPDSRDSDTTITVDIVSDVVCPWCIIGYRQLAEAARKSGIDIEVHWHPFELNPQMGEEGENLREHIAAKYGTSDEDSRSARERLTQMGADLGFTFNYADDMRMVNTFRAHQLIDWAEQRSPDEGHRMKQALFSAFFTERRDLHRIDVLADVAASLGHDRDEVVAMLESGERGESVRQRQAFWQQQGISGVPAMVFNRRYLVTGAQGVENYQEVLAQVAAERAEVTS